MQISSSNFQNRLSKPLLSNNGNLNTNNNNPFTSTYNQFTQSLPSPNSSSKLHQYFSSSEYLSQQEQLTIFIQDFPQICLQTHRSLNDILPLLIRQNQILARKCQQQIIMIKQSYQKHQNIMKNTKRYKDQLQKINSSIQSLQSKNQEQNKTKQKQHKNIQTKLILAQDYIQKSNNLLNCILIGEYKKCEQLSNQRNYRLVFEDYKTQQNLNNNSGKVIHLQNIQKSCKSLNKKFKYFSKVKSSVEEFCHRLTKIAAVVPGEILKVQLSKECDQFIQLIHTLINLSNGEGTKKRKKSYATQLNQIIKDDPNGNLKSMASQSSLQTAQKYNNLLVFKQSLPQLQNQYNIKSQQPRFFEQTLLTLYKQSQTKSQQTSFQLQIQIQTLTNQLKTLKQYYEQFIINFKMQYEEEKRQFSEEVVILKQTTVHYEKQLEKKFSLIEELRANHQIIEGQNQAFCQQISILKMQVQNKQKQIQLFNYHQQQNKAHFESQLLYKTQSYHKQIQEITQKHTIISQQSRQQIDKLKKLNQDLQTNIKQLKKQNQQSQQFIQNKQNQTHKLNKRLHSIEEGQIKKLEEQIHQIAIQIKNHKNHNKQLLKNKQQLTQQVQLHTSYIKQLEQKIQSKDQALNKINSKLSTLEQQKKSSTKHKEILTQMQNTISNLQVALRNSQDQNISLKRLIKQMKKQLQEVYRTLNDLKSIQKDRERLILDNQKSQRWKQQIMRDYDELKYEILKVQTQNRDLKLETKHYKNIIKRIQMIN